MQFALKKDYTWIVYESKFGKTLMKKSLKYKAVLNQCETRGFQQQRTRKVTVAVTIRPKIYLSSSEFGRFYYKTNTLNP